MWFLGLRPGRVLTSQVYAGRLFGTRAAELQIGCTHEAFGEDGMLLAVAAPVIASGGPSRSQDFEGRNKMRKHLVLCVGLLLAWALAPVAAHAQQDTFLHVACFKVLPGKAGEFQDFLATRLAQASVGQGRLVRWTASRGIIPRGEDADCDFTTARLYSGMPSSLQLVSDRAAELQIGCTHEAFGEDGMLLAVAAPVIASGGPSRSQDFEGRNKMRKHLVLCVGLLLAWALAPVAAHAQQDTFLHVACFQGPSGKGRRVPRFSNRRRPQARPSLCRPGPACQMDSQPGYNPSRRGC